MEDKFIAYEKLRELFCGRAKSRPGRRVVLCHGCFDIVHPGHIRHLRSAAEEGDYLIVSITPDVCVGKGSNRPFVPEALRVENLKALSFVNAVSIAPGDTAIEVIEAVRPNIYVKGNEYARSRDPRFLKEKALVEKQGGKIVYTSGDVVFSSTDIIGSHDLDGANAEKLSYLCRRYKITRKALDESLLAMREQRILVVGEALIDEFKYCESMGLASDAPILAAALKACHRYAGGAALTAARFAALGANVTFLTSVNPRDPNFPVLQDFLKSYSVRVVNILDPRRAAVVKTRYIVANHKVFEVENDPYRPLDSKRRDRSLKVVRALIRSGIRCFVYSDFGYGFTAEPMVNEAADFAISKNALVVGNLSTTLRTQIGKFYHADIFIPSERELRACFHDYESGLSVLVDRLYRATSIGEVYLTMSDRGALFFRRPEGPAVYNMETAHIPPLAKRCEDHVGLNDAFLVGATSGRLTGATEVQSLYLGAVFRALHGLSRDHRPITIDDVHHFLDERPELRE